MASTLSISSSYATVQNATFANNTATGLGTVAIDTDSSFYCNLCAFSYNQANDSAAFFLNNNVEGWFQVTNSSFTGNTAGSNLMNIFESVGLI